MDLKLHLLIPMSLVVPMMYRVLLLLLLQDPSSVSHVYSSYILLSGFTGTLTFSYLEGELNDIVEGDLVLELQADDDSWTTYNGTVDEVKIRLATHLMTLCD